MTTDPLTIRSYAESDEAQVIQLWREVFPDNPSWNVPKSDIDRKLAVQRAIPSALSNGCASSRSAAPMAATPAAPAAKQALAFAAEMPPSAYRRQAELRARSCSPNTPSVASARLGRPLRGASTGETSSASTSSSSSSSPAPNVDA